MKMGVNKKGASIVWLHCACAVQLLLMGSLAASESVQDAHLESKKAQDVPAGQQQPALLQAASRQIEPQEDPWKERESAVWRACQAVLDQHSDILKPADQRRVVQSPAEKQQIIYVDEKGQAYVGEDKAPVGELLN